MKDQQNTKNCGNNCKNNKPTDVKQDNKNKANGSAQNVKQDNKNCKNKADKLSSDTIVGGTRYFNTRRDADDDI